MRALTVFVFAFGLFACATSFTGSAKVSGGAEGCAARCQALGMELAGMVLLGEYSDGCICQKPGAKVDVPATGAAAGAGAVGVVEARRADKHSSLR